MFGKLVKHELYTSGRVMLPVSAVLVAISLLTNLAGRTLLSGRHNFSFLNLMCILVLAAFFLGIFAIGVVAVCVMIKRFRDSMLTDQGYLTNTLPVSVHALVVSRLLTAMVYFILVGLVIMLAVLLAGAGTELYQQAAAGIREVLKDEYFREVIQSAELWKMVLQLGVTGMLSMIASCLMMYLAMSIGYSSANHKGLFSFIAYFVISIATQTVVNAISLPLLRIIEDENRLFALNFTAVILLTLAEAAIYYLGTVHMLKHKLNLA